MFGGASSLIHIFIRFNLLLDTLNLHMLKIELNMIWKRVQTNNASGLNYNNRNNIFYI